MPEWNENEFNPNFKRQAGTQKEKLAGLLSGHHIKIRKTSYPRDSFKLSKENLRPFKPAPIETTRTSMNKKTIVPIEIILIVESPCYFQPYVPLILPHNSFLRTRDRFCAYINKTHAHHVCDNRKTRLVT